MLQCTHIYSPSNVSFSFLHLVQHRFASHCCEALFTHAAPVVSAEMTSPPVPDAGESGEDVVAMEDLFLNTLQELDTYLGYLLTDKFASHTLRVLLAVLSGLPLSRPEKGSVLYSKKKEHISVVSTADPELALDRRVVPISFTTALDKFVAQSVSGFDTQFLQSLAMHPTGNPTLQLLLQIELTVFGKQKAKDESSIIHKLLPDDPIGDDSVSGRFINGCVYDTLGSRLLETIVKYVPGKLFKSIYKNFLKDRIAQHARNDTASYIVCTTLTRLSKEDLTEARDTLAAQMPTLVERNRIVVIRTLIERYQVRDVDPTPITTAVRDAYQNGQHNFDITHMLKLSNPTPSSSGATAASTIPKSDTKDSKASHAAEKLHGSLLAQTMLTIPGSLDSGIILNAFASLGTPLLIQVAKDPSASRALQAALTTPHAPVIARRKIIQHFYGHIAELALDPSASHVIDAIWTGTQGLAFIRERIAEELAENEAALRESQVGRAVWRNWRMDLYKRRRKDWVLESRAAADNDSFLPFPTEENGHIEDGEDGAGRKLKIDKHLSAIEKARLKHANAKREKEEKEERSKRKKREGGHENGDAAGVGGVGEAQVATDANSAPLEEGGDHQRKRQKSFS